MTSTHAGAKTSTLRLDQQCWPHHSAPAHQRQFQRAISYVTLLCSPFLFESLSPIIFYCCFVNIVETNHLGPYLLTRLLLDKLKESKGRIVMVSSGMHMKGTNGQIDKQGILAAACLTV